MIKRGAVAPAAPMKSLALVLGPVLAALCCALAYMSGLAWPAAATVGVTALVVTWWITEALPIPVTSIAPFALLPLFGVLEHKAAASSIGNHLIVLMMGAFMLSRAVEKSGVHRRLALHMVRAFGGHNPARVIFGFMAASALLSMWISNTATMLMLLPIALAVCEVSDNRRFATALLLGIAYAASIGGIGTPIGTPPNVIFMAVYQEQFGAPQHFLSWMQVGVPVVLVGAPLAALWLTRGLHVDEQFHLPQVGAWRTAERRVLAVFALVVLAWVFRKAPFGGWTGLLGVSQVGDSTIALGGVLAMCVIPDGRGGRLLDWQTAGSIPWGLLLLFAGGICLAKGYQASGLSAIMGEGLSALADWPVFAMILALCLGVTFLTEITSNTATTTLLMPVLALAGVAAGIDARLLMIPAAISASCAFMLPVATAPNAIAYGTNKVSIRTMSREGLALNLIMAGVIATLCYFLL